MARKPNVVSSKHLTISLPEDIKARLDIFLFSEVENRVPRGAYMEFFTCRIKEFLGTIELDLSPFIGSMPGLYSVRGSPTAIAALRAKLES